jgi:hypothetical protein
MNGLPLQVRPGGQVHSPGTLIWRGSLVSKNGLPLQVLPGRQVHSHRTLIWRGSPSLGASRRAGTVHSPGTVTWIGSPVGRNGLPL